MNYKEILLSQRVSAAALAGAGLLFIGGVAGAEVDGADAPVAVVAQADDTALEGAALVERNFLRYVPSIGEVEANPSTIANVYEVAVNGTTIYYTSDDGRYVIQGDMIDLETRENITELRRSGARLEVMADLDPEATILFAPKDKPVEHEITVFTDIDCGYCRKLHREIVQLNNLGVAVRYAFFPRSGPNSPSWLKAQQVACANNPNVALTKAKAGEELVEEACDTDAINQGWSIGRSAGVTGTPAIVTKSGYLIAGYLPAPQLKERLDQLTESEEESSR